MGEIKEAKSDNIAKDDFNSLVEALLQSFDQNGNFTLFKSGCSVYLNFSQSFPSGATTLIEFNSVIYDHNNEFDVDNHKFVAKQAGYYLVIVAVWFNVAKNVRIQPRIYRIGSLMGQNISTYNPLSGSACQASNIVYLAKDQEITGRIYLINYTDGANISIYQSSHTTYMSIQRVF